MNAITEKHKAAAICCLMKEWDLETLSDYLSHTFPDPTEEVKYTDEQIALWGSRHEIPFCLTDLRCAFEDAATLNHYTAKGEES